MDYKTIELNLCQLEESFAKSRSNIYSDFRKEEHFQELYALFQKIKENDYQKFDEQEILNHNYLLNVIFKSLEYLDNSTLNVTPYEIISCLEFALNDWIKDDDFIIVTSLSNKKTDFYLETTLSEESFELLNQFINNKYGLKISKKLIQISLPKILSRDYLSSVVLYHELGHFVDNQLNISKKMLLKKYSINQPNDDETSRYLNHTMEYFADLFAAQYVNNSSNTYLGYIAPEHPDSQTHPATRSRINVSLDFLNSKSIEIVDEFNKLLHLSSLPLLEIRHSKIDISYCNLTKLYPQNFEDVSELHYIFQLGWDIWEDAENNFLKEFSSRQRYNIVNNLIEKSISNYVVQKNWEDANE
ncbi:M48 family metalloprotease [Nonlabens xiamenensis]|uniref:hypothetical protein n=1 Tax=Nonlabens xiamenensis TaxID=2341043 RepID=UPI000F615385|nr:hypothetical protein [Nonlabens xiamenensis]